MTNVYMTSQTQDQVKLSTMEKPGGCVADFLSIVGELSFPSRARGLLLPGDKTQTTALASPEADVFWQWVVGTRLPVPLINSGRRLEQSETPVFSEIMQP